MDKYGAYKSCDCKIKFLLSPLFTKLYLITSYFEKNRDTRSLVYLFSWEDDNSGLIAVTEY